MKFSSSETFNENVSGCQDDFFIKFVGCKQTVSGLKYYDFFFKDFAMILLIY